jgi:glutamate-1-semialdehyde aminotransferase
MITVKDQLPLGRSAELETRARRTIPGVTQTGSKRPEAFAPGHFPGYVEHGRGAHVWDVDGTEYIDFIMACGPATLGYCYPAVDQAIAEQLRRGIIFTRPTAVEVEVAEMVTEMVPCAEMVRFFKGGVEANSAALRIARAYTDREGVVSCGYRGWHDQWALTYNPRGIPRALTPLISEFKYNDLGSLEQALESRRGQVAAVILDPVSDQAPQPGFLAGVKELAHRHGALLIFDEIVTGFRLANGGAQQYFDITPDMAVFAKGIANGMPLSAVTGSREIMRTATDVFLTLTYGDEALSLAAARATLNECRRHDVCGHLWRVGQALMDGVSAAIAATGAPFALGGLAPMPAFTCTGQFRGQPLAEEEVQRVWLYLLAELARRGVMWRRQSLILLSYSHTDEDIAYTVAACREVLANLVDRLAEGTLDAEVDLTPPPVFNRLR